jgi:hypothetical protein
MMKREARKQYQHEVMIFVSGGYKDAPKVPDILKD